MEFYFTDAEAGKTFHTLVLRYVETDHLFSTMVNPHVDFTTYHFDNNPDVFRVKISSGGGNMIVFPAAVVDGLNCRFRIATNNENK